MWLNCHRQNIWERLEITSNTLYVKFWLDLYQYSVCAVGICNDNTGYLETSGTGGIYEGKVSNAALCLPCAAPDRATIKTPCNVLKP